MKTIASRQNPTVRLFRDLAAAPDPTGARLLLDGGHLVDEAVRAGTHIEIAAVAASKMDGDNEERRLARTLAARGVEVVVASDTVFATMSPVRTPAGIVAIGRREPATVAAVCARAGIIVVAADVQDPGNVGSLLRAAEAGGADGMLVCGASASPFSWKAIRGSMGSVLRLPVAAASLQSAIDCLRNVGARIIASVARGGDPPDRIDWRGRVGLLLGGEGAGLDPAIAAGSDARVTIPMAAPVESLNVAVAGALLVYAARAQRS